MVVLLSDTPALLSNYRATLDAGRALCYISDVSGPTRVSAAFGNSSRMTAPSYNLPQRFGIASIALVVTFITLMFATDIVDGLPRPVAGKPVQVPWWICVVGSVSLSLLPPWLVSLLLLHERRLRRYFFFCLVGTVAFWLVFGGFSDTLSRAYRRGL